MLATKYDHMRTQFWFHCFRSFTYGSWFYLKRRYSCVNFPVTLKRSIVGLPLHVRILAYFLLHCITRPFRNIMTCHITRNDSQMTSIIRYDFAYLNVQGMNMSERCILMNECGLVKTILSYNLSGWRRLVCRLFLAAVSS
jgi:hypothetical protein